MSAAAAIATNGLAPEQFLAHYRAIKDTKRVKDEAAAAHKAAREAAKAAGVNMNALKIVEHLSNVDDADAEIEMRETLRYAAWMGLEVGTQSDLFGSNDGPKLTDKIVGQHAEWKAEQAGYEAGKAGKPVDECPYPGASPMREHWSSGWRDGAAIRDLGRKPQDDEPAEG